MTSKCACSIDSGDGYGDPDAFTCKQRKARKEHECCECLEVIAPGQTYTYESGIWEGEPNSFKTCADCVSVRDTFFCSFRFGTLWDEFYETTWECDGKYAPECIAQLTPAAKKKVLKMISQARRGNKQQRKSK